MEDLETKMLFVSYRARGWSFDRIARELEISKPTLINWGKEWAAEIEEQKTIELERCREEVNMAWPRRIALFAEKLQRIEKEFEKRSMSELSTSKLHDLYIKYSNCLVKATPERGLVKDKPEKVNTLESLFGK